MLGSAIIDLPGAFLAVGREVRDGRFTPKVESFGLESGVIRYEQNATLAGLVPPELHARLQAARDSIVAGTLDPVHASSPGLAQAH